MGSMKFFVNIFLLICVAKTAVAVRKCGIIADRCQLLTNGDMYWPPEFDKECSSIPICPRGYRLHREMIGDLPACCCKVKRIDYCPDCDMANANKMTFSEWIDLHLARNGPGDGLCEDSKVKRIFFGDFNQLDKCCCEPRNSPFSDIFSTE